MNCLPTPLANAFTKIIDALLPLSSTERRRVLSAASAATSDLESKEQVSQIGSTILPSIHPDTWTGMPPKLPPMSPPNEPSTKRLKPRKRNPR